MLIQKWYKVYCVNYQKVWWGSFNWMFVIIWKNHWLFSQIVLYESSFVYFHAWKHLKSLTQNYFIFIFLNNKKSTKQVHVSLRKWRITVTLELQRIVLYLFGCFIVILFSLFYLSVVKYSSKITEGLTLWCNGLSHCWLCWHLMQAV